jgi:hypothetical protein
MTPIELAIIVLALCVMGLISTRFGQDGPEGEPFLEPLQEGLF